MAKGRIIHSKRRDRRIFRKGLRKTKAVNVYRGGIRF